MKQIALIVLIAGSLAACGSPRGGQKSVSTEPAAPTSPVEQPAPRQSTEAPPKADSPIGGLREVFPHVRADMASRLIEFDGTVPIDAHDPRTPVVYIEVTVCTPDTKEHESLVVTLAKPSHIHAALLAAGFGAGAPGTWTWDGQKITAHPPNGDALDISIAYRDAAGREVEAPATSWIRNAAANGPKFGAAPGSRFVFAGSAMVTRQGRDVYDADGSGLLVGLTTFGSESIAWSEVISHEAEFAEPEWIADSRVVPPFGTPVVVRIRPISGAPAR